MANDKIAINRAPVLTLWASVVAKRLGYNQDAALTLGKAVAGLNAQSKGQRLGIYRPAESTTEKGEKPKRRKEGDEFTVIVMGRPVRAVETDDGIRAAIKGNAVNPASVRSYLQRKFGEDLPTVTRAMEALAKAYRPQELAARAYALYEEFRPEIPAGTRGWGAKGELDLGHIRDLAKKKPHA